MNYSQRPGRLLGVDACRRRPFLIVPIWAALILLAAGAALASAVNAALFILAALACASVLAVGWFVFSGDGAEKASPTAAPPSLAGNRPPVVFLPARARADEAAAALCSPQCYFPVAQGGEIVGVLPKAALLRAMANGWGDRLIVELMAETVSSSTGTGGRTNQAREQATDIFSPSEDVGSGSAWTTPARQELWKRRELCKV